MTLHGNEFARALSNEAQKGRPIVLVIDLDETVIHTDEEGMSTRQEVEILYRAEIFSVLDFLRNVFGRRLFLVLWSTGRRKYILHVLHLLGLNDFDLILSSSDSEESELKYDASKSPSYLQEQDEYTSWLLEIEKEDAPRIPLFAIIDDKAFENTSAIEPYNYTFQPRPLTYHTLCRKTMDANIQSLYRYVDTIVFDQVCLSDSNFRAGMKKNDEPTIVINAV